MSDNGLVIAESKLPDERFDSTSCKEEEECEDHLGQRSSKVGSSPRGGLEHFTRETAGTERNLLISGHEVMLTSSSSATAAKSSRHGFRVIATLVDCNPHLRYHLAIGHELSASAESISSCSNNGNLKRRGD
ncbi:uncharacterized protein LOC110266338 [Arachis ipaensis]|uniref:UDP-sugar-dependent glycosyltransferase n=1 Tax=Arachis hypogaea TaxID=3818 RepID=A0A6B9V696_ARAHY|nr:uncharacterized protein LOC110266338 [Arachis ipaensis]QHN76575.1 UDP-sugar-dependent glycosyltransferase [Arachis hypogaea]